MKPVALTDSQLDIVFRLAAPLLAADRPAFLEDVARSLGGLAEIGDGAVARTCAEVQKRYWRAPELEPRRMLSRWDRARPGYDRSSKRAF
jgi:hypothetical protein